jgi:diguanylate cyclase (GGDEF)-like protein
MNTQTIAKPIEILLVENNPEDVRLFRESLAEAGAAQFDLTCVGQLTDTIERLDKEQYDIVMLDPSLPDSQGFNTFINVRMHAPKVPVILLTGTNDEELAVKALQNGAQDYLIKGQVDGSLLSRSIRYAIERHHARQKEHCLAYFDVLTSLPNRQLFYDRLNQALSYAHRYKQKVALLFIDLDGFKLVNDSLGHDVGDLLLQAVAKRLEDSLRESDTVARLGGDEFTCILPNIEKSGHVTLVARKMIRALSGPFDLKGHEINISGSIGITIFPDDTDDFGELIKNADIAMYHAKKQGKNNFQFFAGRLNVTTPERILKKDNLRMAPLREKLLLKHRTENDNFLTKDIFFPKRKILEEKTGKPSI